MSTVRISTFSICILGPHDFSCAINTSILSPNFCNHAPKINCSNMQSDFNSLIFYPLLHFRFKNHTLNTFKLLPHAFTRLVNPCPIQHLQIIKCKQFIRHRTIHQFFGKFRVFQIQSLNLILNIAITLNSVNLVYQFYPVFHTIFGLIYWIQIALFIKFNTFSSFQYLEVKR